MAGKADDESLLRSVVLFPFVTAFFLPLYPLMDAIFTPLKQAIGWLKTGEWQPQSFGPVFTKWVGPRPSVDWYITQSAIDWFYGLPRMAGSLISAIFLVIVVFPTAFYVFFWLERVEQMISRTAWGKAREAKLARQKSPPPTKAEGLVKPRKSKMEKLGRIVGPIWRGPFYVGKLVQPISAGAAILKLFEVVWRIIVLLAVLAIVAGLGIWALVTVQDAARPTPFEEQISISVRRNPKACGNDMPLEGNIANRSNRNLGKIDFSVEAFAPGRSSNLVDTSVFGNGDYEPDYIVPANDSVTLCFTEPKLTQHEAGLRYTAKVTLATPWEGPMPPKPPIVTVQVPAPKPPTP